MNSELLDRPPPHDLSAEKGVVAAGLIKPDVLDDVAPLVRPDDFHDSRLGRIYKHATDLWNGGRGALDVTLLQSAMNANGGWTDDDAALIAEALHDTPTAANAAHYAKIVRDKARRRRIITAATDILQAAYNGTSSATLQSKIRSTMEGIGAGGGVDFAPMTLAELMQRNVTVEYLIDGLLAARQPILLAGPVKSMKTSILLDLCFALATGGCLLGYFRVNRAIGVGVLTGESGLPTVKDTLNRIGDAAGINPADVTRLIVSDRVPHLSNQAHLDAIRKLVLDYELELLAIDPAYLALDGGDAANVMVFGQQLRAVSELCQEMGTALLLCHHTRKGAGIDGQPLELTDAAWSGFAEHCRQWFLVNHRERFDEETGTARLWLRAGGSAGHSGLWAVDVHQGRLSDPGGRVWEVRVSTPDEAKAAERDQRSAQRETRQTEILDADRQEVVAAAVQVGGPETKNGLRDRVGCGYRRFDVAFASLVADGTLQPATVKRANGHQYEGWEPQNEQ